MGTRISVDGGKTFFPMKGKPGTFRKMKLKKFVDDQDKRKYGIGITHLGETIVPITDLVSRQVITPSPRYKSTNAKLFDEGPKLEDIKQTNLGDCYLQSQP